MRTLTDHEAAVLMIAAEGKSMIPIGVWEKPIQNLSALGLLKRLDAFNFVITDNGRAILDKYNSSTQADFASVFGELLAHKNAHTMATDSVNQAATHLVLAARASAKLTENTPEQEIWTLGQNVITRAMELFKDGKQ